IVVNVVVYGICRWWFAEAFEGFATAVNVEFAAAAAVRARKRQLATVPVGGGGSGSGETPETGDAPGASGALSDAFYDGAGEGTIEDPEARGAYQLCWLILGGLIALLVTHKQVEHLLGLHEGT